jgi:hypothetical protein
MEEDNYRWKDNIKSYVKEKCGGLRISLIRGRVETGGILW